MRHPKNIPRLAHNMASNLIPKHRNSPYNLAEDTGSQHLKKLDGQTPTYISQF